MQLNHYKKKKVSKKKSHNTQHSLLRIVESLKAELNNDGKVGATITDL